ncbi:MAG: hypothetical protein M3Z98_00770 [Candidatus Dormibacteraeota bacterium]|nr:hypothetical protein [Candidatus Dormibacteraeota bacterium]
MVVASERAPNVAQNVAQPDSRLLPGEDRRSRCLTDAQHWALLYVELTQDASDLGHPDADWYAARRDFWLERLQKLQALPASV